jgi:hypothetical protein
LLITCKRIIKTLLYSPNRSIMNRLSTERICRIVKKRYDLQYIKHETKDYYEVRFYLPFNGDTKERITFTHNVSIEHNSLIIRVYFPDLIAVLPPHKAIMMEQFEDSDNVISFDKSVQEEETQIVWITNEDEQEEKYIGIRVFKC